MSSACPHEVADTLRLRARAGRALLLALLAVGALLVLAGQARAAAVQVTPTEGPPVTLDLDQMPAPPDISARNYTVRSEAGERQVTVSGYSLPAVLEMAGVDPIVVGYFEIARPGGGALLLSRHQATTEGVFPEGPPVLFRDDAGLHLLRPSAGGSDFNESDLITVPQDGTLAITARSGRLIEVSAKASKRKVKVGQEVRFTATLDRAAAGEEVNFSWYFDDGSSAAGAEVTHRFRQAGLYDVVVGVTTPGDKVGASATVTVQVGTPNKQGPKRRGGGNNKDKNAPDSGASEGGSGPAGPPSSAPTGSPGPPSSYSPSNVSPPSPSQNFSPPAPTQVPEAKPEPQKQPERPRGDEITGQLLAATDIDDEELPPQAPEASKASEQPPAARTGSTDPIGGGGIPGAAIGVGTALLLLAGGGLLEARGIGPLRW